MVCLLQLPARITGYPGGRAAKHARAAPAPGVSRQPRRGSATPVLESNGIAGWVESSPDERGAYVVSVGGAAGAEHVTPFNRLVSSLAEQPLPVVIDLTQAESLHPLMAAAIAGWVEHGGASGVEALVVAAEPAPVGVRDQLDLAAGGLLPVWPDVGAAIESTRPG